jgi:hypothetical protein
LVTVVEKRKGTFKLQTPGFNSSGTLDEGERIHRLSIPQDFEVEVWRR